MRLKQIIPAVLVMLAPLIALAQNPQNPQQELNDQFWEAVRKGDVAQVTAFLDKGVDVNAKFRYGQTALFKAAERGHTDVVKLLLARGADVTVKDSFYGATAMTWALENRHIGAVSALLEKDNASVNEVLMTGAREGNAELVGLALAKGTVKPENLTAALVTSQTENKTEIVEMLKKAGATPPMELDAAMMQAYAGKYKPEQGNEVSILIKDGKLFAQFGARQIAMMALDKTTFRPTAFDGFAVTFTVEGDKATSFALKEGSGTTVYKRVVDTK